jgi:transposase
VTGWLTRHPDTLTEDEQVQLKAIVEQCPELRAAAGHIRAFGEMLTKLRGQDLPAWIAAVRADNLPGLASFAAHLEHDLAAVSCGLRMRWNSGPIEGRVNHIILWNLSCQASPVCSHSWACRSKDANDGSVRRGRGDSR